MEHLMRESYVKLQFPEKKNATVQSSVKLQLAEEKNETAQRFCCWLGLQIGFQVGDIPFKIRE